MYETAVIALEKKIDEFTELLKFCGKLIVLLDNIPLNA